MDLGLWSFFGITWQFLYLLLLIGVCIAGVLMTIWPVYLWFLTMYLPDRPGPRTSSGAKGLVGRWVLTLALVGLTGAFSYCGYKYYTTMPWHYVVWVGWRPEALADAGLDSEDPTVPSGLVGRKPQPGEPQDLSPFYHYNIVAARRLDSYFIRSGLAIDWPKATASRVILWILLFPLTISASVCALLKVVLWWVWSGLLMFVYPFVSPFLVGALTCLGSIATVWPRASSPDQSKSPQRRRGPA